MALGRVKTMEIVYIDDHPWICVEWGEPGCPMDDVFINVQKTTHIVLKSTQGENMTACTKCGRTLDENIAP